MRRFSARAGIITLLMTGLIATAALATPDLPVAPLATSASAATFDLVRIEGDYYVVKDASGQEKRLHVSKDTDILAPVKPGDRIEAWVQSDGHAKTIMIVKSAPAP
ncbi:MAG: hypothetical protein ACT4OO_15100 [Nitrospiraceae bacterium]